MTPVRYSVGWHAVLGVGVAVAGLALGGLTSWGQTVLPFALAPLSNSISGWTIMVALIVWLTRSPILWSAIYGAIGFVALVCGYSVISNARGYPYGGIEWIIIGTLAGPVVGAAAGALHDQRSKLVAVGSGVLGGILIGDGIRGLVSLAATTGWYYWAFVTTLGIALLVAIQIRFLREARSIGLQIGVVALVAVGMNLALLLLEQIQ